MVGELRPLLSNRQTHFSLLVLVVAPKTGFHAYVTLQADAGVTLGQTFFLTLGLASNFSERRTLQTNK